MEAKYLAKIHDNRGNFFCSGWFNNKELHYYKLRNYKIKILETIKQRTNFKGVKL